MENKISGIFLSFVENKNDDSKKKEHYHLRKLIFSPIFFLFPIDKFVISFLSRPLSSGEFLLSFFFLRVLSEPSFLRAHFFSF
jgi:hypothetical protein